MTRGFCPACLKPPVTCYCAGLRPFRASLRFLILTHPAERRKAINTGRMASLSLLNSVQRYGVSFHDDPVVQTLLGGEEEAWLLWPDGGGESRPGGPAATGTVVVLDGTWSTARTMLRENPVLQQLPRLPLDPARPSAYAIRRQPDPRCLSTIEAIHQLLEAGGQDPHCGRLMTLFRSMVMAQLEFAAHPP